MPNWREWKSSPGGSGFQFDAAEIGALAHLYRGEVYCSTIWRTRLDATTNWSVVTLGLALSMSFADPDASPAPLESLDEFLMSTSVGHIPGAVILGVGVVFHAAWIWLAVWSRRLDRAKHHGKDGVTGMG